MIIKKPHREAKPFKKANNIRQKKLYAKACGESRMEF